MSEISLISGIYPMQYRQKNLWQPRQPPRIYNRDTSCNVCLSSVELNQRTRTYRKDVCT